MPHGDKCTFFMRFYAYIQLMMTQKVQTSEETNTEVIKMSGGE